MKPYCYIDYPIVPLGDKEGELAPIRRVWPIAWDGDKYVIVAISEGGRTVLGWIKRGYLYLKPMTLDQANSCPTHGQGCWTNRYDVSHLEVDTDEFLSIHVDWS